MPQQACITQQEIKLRLDRVFGAPRWFKKRQDLEFLKLFTETGMNIQPAFDSKGTCTTLKVSWKDICRPDEVVCSDSCDLTVADNENCIDETYPLSQCFQVADYGFNTANYECITEVNSGEVLTHSLIEAIADKELEVDLQLVEGQIIPYMIGIIDGAASAPVTPPSGQLPSNVTVNGAGEVLVKPQVLGSASFYNIVKKLAFQNNITRPALLIGNEALQDAYMINQIEGKSMVMAELFNEIPFLFDWNNITSNVGSEAIYLVNLDAFVGYSWNEVNENINPASTNLLDSLYRDTWLRWKDESRFATEIKFDRYQKVTCVSDNHELIGRRTKAHFEIFEAPDGVCNNYPKVIKIVCDQPTP